MAPTAPSQPRYRLADHVRACHVDGQVILLDLNKDRYIGVDGAPLSGAAHWIADWPLTHPVVDDISSRADLSGWVRSLQQAGLITTASSTRSQQETLAEARESLGAPDPTLWAGVQWRRIASIAHATFIAARWLKRRSLAEIADHVRHLRPGSASCMSTPTEHLRSAVGWYLRVRPFAISSQDECLHDSLTLLRFLASEGMYPHWVVGVRTRPFAAHSWAQAGGLVLNDLHENVRGFTPILVV